ncbi:hypothetical protein KK083_14820 [Fulvivirgaceae bacterium PWU4]|uniref:Uncharacterized protein n=1 Tax=Chryseosolibacter histidini TaxID=2782349 RepID=A0AAP2DKP3_9BACT|nr:hypothetical protein [Chryseosolibacter histidini]MBT1698163.1 hypothetical protein [Chryseosolibacter histidini]
MLRPVPPSGPPLDMALTFVHGYTWLKDDPGPSDLHRQMSVAAYKRNLALFKAIISSEDPKTPFVDVGASVLLKLVNGSSSSPKFLSGSPSEKYVTLLREFLAPEKWNAPVPTKDFLLTGYPSLEASYKFELGREPETWTWLDKWNRALRIDPIVRALSAPQNTPTQKRARGLLAPNSKELTGNGPVDSFLKAYREINQLRSLYVTDVGSAAQKAHERRKLLALDLLVLGLNDPVREVFDNVGLWPVFQYCAYVEVWWLYIEHLVVRCSLPLDEVHYSLSSVVAVAIFEAITGMTIPAPNHSSYLNAPRHAKQKQDESGSLRIELMPIWGALTVDEAWAQLWTLAMEGVKTPFILRNSLSSLESPARKGETGTSVRRADVAITAGELVLHWPRYPETHKLPSITNDAWDENGDKFSISKHSRYTAQLKLFVAASISKLAVTDLGLPAPLLKLVDDTYNKTQAKEIKIHWDQSDDPARSRATLTERVPLLQTSTLEIAKKETLTEAEVMGLNLDRSRYSDAINARTNSGLVSPLRLVAGCFPWGGRKLPHITHRDGLTFDLQMGADSQRWPPIDENVTRHLEGAISINWPGLLRILARSNRADSLSASTITHAPGEGRKAMRMTLQEVQSGYRDAVVKYQRVMKELKDKPFPLPLSVAGRTAVTRLAVQLHRDGDSAKARVLYNLVVITTLGEKMARRVVANPLILRHSSMETGAFKGENRQLIFRGLITDVLVQPTIARVEAIVRHVLVKNIDNKGFAGTGSRDALMKGYEPELNATGEWESIERRIQDLPLAHTEAGVQRGLIATISLLLSGMRMLIFGAPALYTRALRVLTEAAKDDVAVANALLTCAGRLTKERFMITEFAFMPHNHSDHHHVQFGAQGYGEMYDRRSADWGLRAELDDLEPMLAVWLDLGIDLKPFMKYLESQKASTAGMPKAMSEERDAIMTLVSIYISDFDKRFLPNRAPNPFDGDNAKGYARFAVARGRLNSLLMRANDSLLIAAKPPQARGTEVNDLSNASIEIMNALKAAIDFRATKEYLEETRKRGLAVTVDPLEIWEDECLTEVAKSLQGPDRFRQRLQQVLNFTVASSPEGPDGETDFAPEERECDISSEFEEEEEFRRAVIQELLERRVPATE